MIPSLCCIIFQSNYKGKRGILQEETNVFPLIVLILAQKDLFFSNYCSLFLHAVDFIQPSFYNIGICQ